MENKVYVGIDVSKDKLDLALRPDGQEWSEGQDDSSLERLVRKLKDIAPALVVLEATGGYEARVAALLATEGIAVSVVNPRQVRDFAKSTGKLAKTDRLDAHAIAHFAEAIQPQVRYVSDEEGRELAALMSRR